ncbi:MAG: hypothetical protein ACR2RL_13375 [Gammaproteobacteria bacterium]
MTSTAGHTGVRLLVLIAMAILVVGCTIAPPAQRPDSAGHINEEAPVPQPVIPPPVHAVPILPPPVAEPPGETYTVVVNDVPARELLFALARDAEINVDIHPGIDGFVTLNAVDQTLDEILDRISRQLPVRYERKGSSVIVEPDVAFFRSYQLDYVNITRQSSGAITTSTEVATVAGADGGSAGNNASDSTITNSSNNQLWESVASDLRTIVAPSAIDGGGARGGENVIVNRESGVVVVRATARQHTLIEDYISRVSTNITRQVLIEATIVEVLLTDRFQAGIDWTLFTRDGGLTGAGLTLGTRLGGGFQAAAGGVVTGLILNAADAPLGSPKRNIEATVSLLKNFGDTRVISSPKIMALNNQAAVLKVVDNEVYFSIELDEERDDTNVLNDVTRVTVTTEVNTVPVGLVMNVTPQVDSRDIVTLNVRPTITTVREFVEDPGVAITAARLGVANQIAATNRIPVVQVRETETVLRVGSGQIAVLGGLIQDRAIKDDSSIPGLSEVELIGDLFKFRDRQQVKTELVIFLRPVVIRTPSINADLRAFKNYLPQNVRLERAIPTPLVPIPIGGQPRAQATAEAEAEAAPQAAPDAEPKS